MSLLYILRATLFGFLLTACSQVLIQPVDQAAYQLDYDKRFREMNLELLGKDPAALKTLEYAGGDTLAYLDYRDGFKEQSKKISSWKRMGMYLQCDSIYAQRVAHQMGFTSPYYFLSYLEDTTLQSPHPHKQEILNELRGKLLLEKPELPVRYFSGRELLNYSFRWSYEKLPESEKHRH